MNALRIDTMIFDEEDMLHRQKDNPTGMKQRLVRNATVLEFKR